MKSLTYQTKKNHLIVYCETKKLLDFFNNISSSVEKDFFIIPKEKETELIKILNYLNFVEKDGNPRFMNQIYEDEEEDDNENLYTSSEKEYECDSREDSSSCDSRSYKKEEYEDEVENEDINKFFKSFANSDFIKKNKNEIEQKMMLEKVKNKDSINSDERKKVNQTKYQEDEYSSSSYNSSSSDNFPSPKTPKRRNNFSNEQLYSMIEKLEKKINLIQRVLEKKIL